MSLRVSLLLHGLGGLARLKAQPTVLDEEVDHLFRPLPRDRSVKPNGRLPRMLAASALHDVEIDVHIGRKVALVDDEEVRTRDARPALARNFLALADRDDIEREIGKVGREGRGKIVAARFDEDDVEVGDDAALISAIACRLMEASSRIAVCGQPPVSTPMMRSSGSACTAPGSSRLPWCRCRW